MDIRPNWCQPSYYQGSKLDLSTNVCYDAMMPQFNMSFAAYPDPHKCYSILSDHYNVDKKCISIGYGLGELALRILHIIKYLGLSLEILDEPTWNAMSAFKQVLDIKTGSNVGYIANPNGNSGKAIQRHDILKLAERYEILIVDESYCDFAGECSIISCRPENVIVLKTLSKASALPGMRFGWCFANDSITEQIQNIRPSHVIVGSIQDILRDILQLIPHHVKRMKETKAFVELNYECVPSHGNYVLLKQDFFKDAFHTKKIDDLYRMALLDIGSFREYVRY